MDFFISVGKGILIGIGAGFGYALYSIFNIAVTIMGTYISSVKFKSCTKNKNLINEVDFS